MNQPLTDRRLAEIEARAKSRRAALSGWLNCYSPLPEQEALEGAEGVLEEDVPALLAEVRRLRAERNRYRNAWHSARARAVDGWGDAKLAEARVGDLEAGRRADHDRIAELEPYERLNPQQCPAGKHADWLIDSEYAHACPWCQIEKLKAGDPDATKDTLPAWLRQRFTASDVAWENLDDAERSYWEHQARAVRRAVARGGFKAPAAEPAAAVSGGEQ